MYSDQEEKMKIQNPSRDGGRRVIMEMVISINNIPLENENYSSFLCSYKPQQDYMYIDSILEIYYQAKRASS